MRTLNILIFSVLILLNIGVHSSFGQENDSATTKKNSQDTPEKISILNFGTFHFGFTEDVNTVEFDEQNKGNQDQAHVIAKKLADFKPTVILVEYPPELNEKLQNSYKEYLNKPDMHFENPTEVELLAFELGRISGVERIYGIDHKMEYNYNIGNEIENSIDSILHNKFYENPFDFYSGAVEKLESDNLLEKLLEFNQEKTLDFLMTINADMLTHAGTKDGFEGADEAAKYYQRNLRMYSNLNRLKLYEGDRVFILLGASHTAFLRDFIKRSPKYEMVNTFEYLK